METNQNSNCVCSVVNSSLNQLISHLARVYLP